MNRVQGHFAEIITLYETVDYENTQLSDEEKQKRLDAIQGKYIRFKQNKLQKIILDIKKIKLVSCTKVDHAGHELAFLSP